jgi:translation elongation factor EF-1beta
MYMERAWVLIRAESDVAKGLVDEISAIRGVRLIDLARGQFALIVAIALPDRDRLTRVVDGIRQMEGVEQVLVCDVIASHRIKTRDADPGWP